MVYKVFNSGGTWKSKSLWQFCGNCSKSRDPFGRVAVDPQGNLYGVTEFGNGLSSDDGVLYEITAKGDFTVLDKFCDPCASNGSHPKTGLTWFGAQLGQAWDGTSGLFGTTCCLGPQNGGTLFEALSGTIYTVVAFDTDQFSGTVVAGPDNLFYTAENKKGGSVYAITETGTVAIWHFCALHTKCKEGSGPQMLTVDAMGNVFGTTSNNGKRDTGTVYEIASPKYKKAKVLHNICSANNCKDGTGALDTTPMAVDATGNIYGTMSAGGAHGKGVIFRIGADGSYTVLYSFCSQTNCTDGDTPMGGLTIDAAGNLYGTTVAGGTSNKGEIFKFTP